MTDENRFSLLLNEALELIESTTSATQTSDTQWVINCLDDSAEILVQMDASAEVITLSAKIPGLRSEHRRPTYELMLMLNYVNTAGLRHGLDAPAGDILLALDVSFAAAEPQLLADAVDFLLLKMALWFGIVARGGLSLDDDEFETLAAPASGPPLIRV